MFVVILFSSRPPGLETQHLLVHPEALKITHLLAFYLDNDIKDHEWGVTRLC